MPPVTARTAPMASSEELNSLEILVLFPVLTEPHPITRLLQNCCIHEMRRFTMNHCHSDVVRLECAVGRFGNDTDPRQRFGFRILARPDSDHPAVYRSSRIKRSGSEHFNQSIEADH